MTKQQVKIRISQSSADEFIIKHGGETTVINEENDTAVFEPEGGSEQIEIALTEAVERRSALRAAAYFLFEVVASIISVLFLLNDDWRELTSPFLLKCSLPLAPGDEMELRYKDGGFEPKTGKLRVPVLKKTCDSTPVPLSLTVNTENIMAVYRHYITKTGITVSLGLALMAVMLYSGLSTRSSALTAIAVIFLLVFTAEYIALWLLAKHRLNALLEEAARMCSSDCGEGE